MSLQQQKIVVLGPISPYRGGISAFNTSLVEALADAGQLVHPIAWDNEVVGLRRAQQIDPSMPVHASAEYVLKWFSPLSWWRAANRIAALAPDLVVAHWVNPDVAPILALINSRVRRLCPSTAIVYVVHNVNPHEPKKRTRALQRVGFKNVSGFIVHAEAERHALKKLISRRRVSASFHPVYDRYQRSSRQLPEILAWKQQHAGKPIVLFFGFVRRYKGLDVLLEALAHYPDARLVVAGEISRDCADVRRQAVALNVDDRVLWLDRYIADNEVSDIFASVDVVALPYRSGSQSGVAGLALALEVPMVATDVGGLAENMAEPGGAFLVPPEDPKALAAALERAWTQRSELLAGIRRHKAERSWSRYSKDLLSFASEL